MIKISPKQQQILLIFLKNKALSSSETHKLIIESGEDLSLVTVKRELAKMASFELLIASGKGRSSMYKISPLGRIFSNVDAGSYCSEEPDKRYGLERFNFELFPAMPLAIFAKDELTLLEKATDEYRARTSDLPPAIKKKELERLIIELSWKSSKIEGNTYTLLDTEKLILENKEAPGHDRKEAQMILNHKEAFNYVRGQADKFKSLTRRNLEELHSILVKGLSVELGWRKRPVGILGSIYPHLVT